MVEVLPVLYSYFTRAGAFDIEALEQQIAWAVDNGASGITLLGLASEGALLTSEEREATIATATRCLPSGLDLYITVQPQVDTSRLLELVRDGGHYPRLIVQAGPDRDETLRRLRSIGLAMRNQPGELGIQVAPGLLEGDFTLDDVQGHPDVVAQLGFVKAEYASLMLARDWKGLQLDGKLLVGKHGLNLIEYLRIGAAGVIPGTEMTPGLVRLSRAWKRGDLDRAIDIYRDLAPYIEFAMQDLVTVVSVGKAVMGRVLGIKHCQTRVANGIDETEFDSALEFWFRHWTDAVLSEDHEAHRGEAE